MVNTTSLAVGNTVQASEPISLQKNTNFEIFGAENPTGILGGAGNPTETLGGSGDLTGTLPATTHIPDNHLPETLTAVPTVRFEKKEVEVMIHQQELNLAVIGKFSHGWPEIGLLRTAIPKQCGLKAEVNIGLLCDRHVLIRCTIAEDYDTLMSRQTFEIKDKNKPYLMKTFKWDVTFNPEEETRFAYGWISFPGLPPHFHGESSLFSMAASVGKPISTDSATRNKTRPSSARVKVEVDLIKTHPKSVLIQVGEGAEITSTSQRIRYDFLPKYCTNCKLQGHDSNWMLEAEFGIETNQGRSEGGKRIDGGRWRKKRKTTGKCNPNPPQTTKQPANSIETPPPVTGTVNTMSLAVGTTVQASEPTHLQQNTIFEISNAENPTEFLTAPKTLPEFLTAPKILPKT
ncbi:hypothetical protein RND71_019075 [Anisodus tanguticus]|uniref:DUF4283 domain-containing protein n=1 Tax=Anisodus tanguticus TaxID=243964 RepID=A0AAE1VK16_9SOLA|nr:hypothetical protein RND71_019075 [Anisodus tanguticus]